MTGNRQASVAGLFYPANAAELRRSVQNLLAAVEASDEPPPKALIVPHAGYIYSGPTAAVAYARLLPYRDRYQRVILLGPCHRVPCSNLAVSGVDSFQTPLGAVPLDKTAITALKDPEVQLFEAAHQLEHSLEVQLPFLQLILDSFTLVPLVVGDAQPDTVAGVIARLWGGDETLIVISSDLSHYLTYHQATERDRSTCLAIESLDARAIKHGDACGAVPVCGLLLEAERRGLAIKTLDLRNSGDTAGSKDQVVGYGAWMLYEPRLGAPENPPR